MGGVPVHHDVARLLQPEEGREEDIGGGGGTRSSESAGQGMAVEGLVVVRPEQCEQHLEPLGPTHATFITYYYERRKA